MNYTFRLNVDKDRVISQCEIDHITDATTCSLKQKLRTQKSLIESSSGWDEAKRKVNEFEYVYSSSKKHFKISNKKTISRAYFKLWEVLRDFHHKIFCNATNKYTTCHIAEGPGGFIECLLDYKARYGLNVTKIFGITLLLQSQTENRVPFWKISKEDCDTHNIYLNKRHSNVGDLYKLKCINNFVDKVGYHSIDLVTGDGGFDFSLEYCKQEENFCRLFLSEIFTALLLQKRRGSFVVKVFDMFTKDTACLISLLHSFYSELYIVKPFTSRPANSEKYLVCVNFEPGENFWEVIQDLRSTIVSKERIMDSKLQKHFSPNVYARIFLYNVYYTNRQMIYLQRTLDEAQSRCKTTVWNSNEARIKQCQEWCKMYDIDT